MASLNTQMRMNKPTAAPWEIVELDAPLDDWTGARFVIRAQEAPGGVCVLIGGAGGKADADLIVAAPEMHAALRDNIGYIPCTCEYPSKLLSGHSGECARKQVQDALAKAEGRRETRPGMTRGHVLNAFEEDFIEDGVVACCECGWRSPKHVTEGNAIEAHAKHAEQATTIVCGVCGCVKDRDGCGCNPEGA